MSCSSSQCSDSRLGPCGMCGRPFCRAHFGSTQQHGCGRIAYDDRLAVLRSRTIQRVATDDVLIENACIIKQGAETPLPPDTTGFTAPLFKYAKTGGDGYPVLGMPSFTAPQCAHCALVARHEVQAKANAIKARKKEKKAKRGGPEPEPEPTLAQQMLAIDPEACSCSKPIYNQWMLGMVNFHFPLAFDDGTEWLVRVKVPSSSPLVLPVERYDLWRVRRETEVATIKWLRDIGAQVPAAWIPETETPDLVYHFLERGKGSSLGQPAPGEKPREVSLPPSIIKAHAAFLLRVADHPFDKIGSLYSSPNSPNGVSVGPLVTPFEDGGEGTGPFTTSRELWLSRIDRELSALEEGTRGSSHAFKITLPDDKHYPIESWLLHAELRRLVLGCDEMARVWPTFLRHGDDKGDHFLVDYDSRVRAAWVSRTAAGVAAAGEDDGARVTFIDWELAAVVPAPEAFTVEGLSGVHRYLTGTDVSVSADEEALAREFEAADRADLAGHVRGARKYHLLRRLVGHRHGPVYQRISSLYKAFGEEGTPQEVAAASGQLYQWRLAAEETHQGDTLEEIKLRYAELDRGDQLFMKRK